MNHLIFYTATNSILRVQKDPFKIYLKKDAKYVFIPEADKFALFHGTKDDTTLIGIDCRWRNKKPNRQLQVLNAIDDSYKPDCVSFFCHGWPKKIQFGFKGKKHAQILGEALKVKGVKQINLYACSCAKPKKGGNFAEWLAKSSGAIVYAHTTRGHATFNPYVRFGFQYNKVFIIEPKSTLWPLWRKELKESETLRFEFPFMTIDAIKNRLFKINGQ